VWQADRAAYPLGASGTDGPGNAGFSRLPVVIDAGSLLSMVFAESSQIADPNLYPAALASRASSTCLLGLARDTEPFWWT
jgi:hypothetical protein